MEIWKPIPEFEGLYEVSNFGRIKSLERLVPEKSGRVRLQPERILRPARNSAGYPITVLCRDGRKFSFTVHRVVMTVFKGFNNLSINHINHIRHDNRLENLEYVTTAENMNHAAIHGRMPKGDSCHLSKLSNSDRKKVLSLKGKMTAREIAKMFGIHRDSVYYTWNRPSSYWDTLD
jgi:hypothetical protein